MNRIPIIVLCCLALHAADTPAPRSVYVLPMANGLDQFVANHLASGGTLAVITDPQKADVILTDRLGQGFEQRMDEIFPPPPAPKPEKKDAKEAKEDKDSGSSAGDIPPAVVPPVGMFASGARGKGNIFLVDAKSRRVLWSMFVKPGETAPQALDKTAGRIVERMSKDLTVKPPKEPKAPKPPKEAKAEPQPAPAPSVKK